MSKENYKRRCFWFGAAVLWMALIFHFSDQKAAESSEISQTITYRMTEKINSIFHLAWEGEKMGEIAEKLELPVRKAAHMTEYAILSWILLGNCMQYPLLKKRCYLLAGIGAVLYAATDEFHQLFIEGRSGEIKDVGIDSIGVLLGLLSVHFALFIYNQKRKR